MINCRTLYPQRNRINCGLFFCLFLWLALPLIARAELAGSYSGDISGTSATLMLQVQAGNLTGRIDAGGYPYDLDGRIVGPDQAQGSFRDPQTGASGEMSLQKQGQQLLLQLQLPGQPQPLVLHFSSSGGGSRVQGPLAGGGAAKGGSSPQVERDPVLVGQWRYTESYSSGSFSGASQTSLVIHPDGRYEYGDSKFAGGGAGIGGSSGGGDVEVGEWKSQNSIVYIRSPGAQQWQPYARYYVDGASMLLTFGDGSKQVWKRVY